MPYLLHVFISSVKCRPIFFTQNLPKWGKLTHFTSWKMFLTLYGFHLELDTQFNKAFGSVFQDFVNGSFSSLYLWKLQSRLTLKTCFEHSEWHIRFYCIECFGKIRTVAIDPTTKENVPLYCAFTKCFRREVRWLFNKAFTSLFGISLSKSNFAS